jgi:transglutaminase-like putative cysteine protease
MQLKVEHTTTFSYTTPVYETATEIRLRPTDSALAQQRVLDFSLNIEPAAPIFGYVDYFGNRVSHFSMVDQHKSLRITSTSIVSTGCSRADSAPIDDIRALDLLHPSTFVEFDDALRDFSTSDGIGAGRSPEEIAEALCRKINETFAYVPGVTDVHSTSSHVLATRRGVCQDFAHVLIAACRMRGIPARYVSGYLYGGPQTELSDRASHAWCEIYTGPETGWLALDPTHDILVDERYVKIGVGRDYADVPPVRGTYKGDGKETMSVVVRVTEV